jgi:hypothetical protein
MQRTEDPLIPFLSPIQESTQPEYSSIPTYPKSQGNYRYDSFDTLTQQFGFLNYSQDAHGKGKATDISNGIVTHVLYLCGISGIIIDFIY